MERPSATKRLGIDYETLKTINPRLVYASISGFGQTGPWAQRPGFDLIAQAMGGVMSITGHPDQPPTKAGVPVADPRILLVVIGRRSASAPASPSRGPGNGILRAETGGRIQAQNAGEQSEFGSQTTLRLTNPPELRGFLSTRKPPRFVGTAWWRTQSHGTGLRRLRSLATGRKTGRVVENPAFGGSQ